MSGMIMRGSGWRARLCAHLGRVLGGEFDGFQFIRQLIEFAGINARKEFGGMRFEAIGFARGRCF